MAEPFLGQINIFPYNFAPRGWAFCNGQLLSIAQNTALFSLLGTTFGGNGQTTFALPDLRGRVANGAGQGPGLSNYTLGQVGGVENTTLTLQQLAAHTHGYTPQATESDAASKSPLNNFIGTQANNFFATSTDGTKMGQQQIQLAGGSQPMSLLQPYLTLNFCIALQGIYPSRN